MNTLHIYSKGSSDTIEIELPEYVGLDFQTYFSEIEV